MIKLITTVAGAYLNTLGYLAPNKMAGQGLRFFCRPFRGSIKAYHKSFLNSADLFSFHYNKVRIQGYRWGSGDKKILFLHGWQSHTFRWKAYIDALPKDEYSLYAIDAPGHGLSGGSYLSVPLYSDVMQNLLETIGPAHAIVSHSLGSLTSLYALHDKPSLPVQKLVLLAPPGEVSDFFAVYKQSLKLSKRTMKIISNKFEQTFHHPVEHFSSAKFASAAAMIPGLIIHDEDDTETFYECAVKINQNWKNSTLIKTKGLGHNLKSKEVVDEVVRFISTPAYAMMGVS